MKKMIRKITAALMALACLPVTGMTALQADALYYWGSSTWEPFADAEPINNHGWGGETAQVYVNVSMNQYRDSVTVVTPRENVIRLVLREDADVNSAAETAAALLDAYYPGFRDALLPETGDRPYYRMETPSGTVVLYPLDYGERAELIENGRLWELYIPKTEENAQEIEAALLRGLAKQHMISEFYGFGETADYQTGFFGKAPIEDYPESRYVYDENVRTEVPIDWDAVQAYLDEHYPGYQVEQYFYSYTIPEEEKEVVTDDICRRIVPDEELTFREETELACELWEQFKLPVMAIYPESANSPAIGHNALESPGDVTLDCELDLLDAIALNKNLLGVEELPDTAIKNADVNGDGTPDAADSLAILRELVGLTEGFAEK